MKPETGMGATIVYYSDRHPVTIIDVSPSGKKIKVQTDNAVRDERVKLEWIPGGFAGHCVNQSQQEWIITPDPQGNIKEFTLRKNGKWVETGANMYSGTFLLVGERVKFYDYNF